MTKKHFSAFRLDGGESVTRDAVTFKSHESYVTLPQLHPNNHFAVYFKIKTMESAGLILFNGRTGYDFLALELYQGFLYYIYDMGGGTQRIRVNTPNALNDNAWHLISLLRPQIEKQLIRVDDFPPTVENMKDYSARRFDLIGPLYLGGVIRTLYNSLPTQVVSKHGFLGCMASLVLNGFDYNIMKDATNKEYTIVEGCSSKPIYHYMSPFMLNIFVYYTCADLEGGQGVQTPPKKSQKYRVSQQYWSGSPKNSKLGHHQHTSETPLKWRFAGVPMMSHV